MMDELLPLIRRATWTVVGFGLFFHASAAEVPDIDSLGRPAQQALQSYFRTGDKASLQNALVSARNDLALKAQSEPARAAIATVLLRTPVNVQGLSSVIAGGDVIEVVSRTPVGKRGVIVTAGWRMDPDRNIQVALQEAEAKFKANYAAHAGQGDAASNAEEQEFLKSDLRYVSARVIARHDHLDKIATLPHVLAVLLQDEAASEREIKAIGEQSVGSNGWTKTILRWSAAQIGTRLPAGCYTTWCSYQTKAATLQTLTIAVAPAIREP